MLAFMLRHCLYFSSVTEISVCGQLGGALGWEGRVVRDGGNGGWEFLRGWQQHCYLGRGASDDGAQPCVCRQLRSTGREMLWHLSARVSLVCPALAWWGR